MQRQLPTVEVVANLESQHVQNSISGNTLAEHQSPACEVVNNSESNAPLESRADLSLMHHQSSPLGVVASPESQQPQDSRDDHSPMHCQSPAHGVLNSVESNQQLASRATSPSTAVTLIENVPARATGSPLGRRLLSNSAPKGQLKGRSKVEKKQKPKRRTKKTLNAQELKYWERQEELKKKSNALMTALRPCLDELAERNFTSLRQNKTAHEQSPYYAAIRQEMAARTTGAIEAIEREEQLVARNLATKLESDKRAVQTAYSVSGFSFRSNLIS